MKRLIRTILFSILLCIVVGCRSSRSTTEIIMGSVMQGYSMNASVEQIDSICNADNLSMSDKDWIITTYTDYETGERIVKRMFIKKISKNEEIIYTISGSTAPFKVVKRITK